MPLLLCIQQWKASDNPSEEHDIADLAKELDNINEDQLDDLAEEGDEGPTDTRCSAKKNISGSLCTVPYRHNRNGGSLCTFPNGRKVPAIKTSLIQRNIFIETIYP